MIIKKKVITILVAVMMMATALAVPSFAFAAEEGATEDAAAQNTESVESTESTESAESTQSAQVEKEVVTVHGVRTQLVSRISLKIKWKRVSGSNGYVVYAYNKKRDKFTKIKTVKSGKKTSYTVKKLKPNKKYYYAVASYDIKKGKKIYSEKSDVVSGKTPKKLTPQTKGFSKTPAAVVRKVARSKKGCAYVHGTAGPRSFDCSGYVYWVYNKSPQVKALHTKRFTRGSAQSEYQELRKYSIGRNLRNAQPGDIVFYSHSGSTSNIHHVALFYGNGKIIHASSPRTGVIIQPATASGPVAAIVRMPGL